MNLTDVVSYFDAHAASWDAEMICSAEIVDRILETALLQEHPAVLDVACGTGVMFPFYLRRGARHVTAIDISPVMAEIAGEKAAGLPIEVLCGDAAAYPFAEKFDAIMIYNAFPHFPEPEKLLGALSGHLLPGGTLTVAHGMSRAAIARHHAGSAARVSLELPAAEEVARWMEPYCAITTIVDSATMYQVTGIVKEDIIL